MNQRLKSQWSPWQQTHTETKPILWMPMCWQSEEILVYSLGIYLMNCDLDDLIMMCDVQRTMFHVGCWVYCQGAVRYCSPCPSFPSPIDSSPVRAKQSSTDGGWLQEREEDVSARLFYSHSLTPVDSHSWTRGSLINCLALIVAVFWRNQTSEITDSWNNLARLDSSVWKRSTGACHI